MPHPVSIPPTRLHLFANIVTGLAPPLIAPPPLDNAPLTDNQRAADPSQNNLNLPNALAPSTSPDEIGDAPRTVSPTDEIAAIFGDHQPTLTKKRPRQRLSDDTKISKALSALESVRVVRPLLRVAIKSAGTIADPIMDRLIECMEFSAETLMICASDLELASTNTPAKKCANQAHRKCGGGGEVTA